MASRSLGTLTLDLVAQTGGFVRGMSKAERASEKWKRQVKRDVDQVARALKTGIVVGATAAAAGIAVIVNASKQAIDEQAKLAKQLNTTSESLANLKRAGELSGVSFKQITTAGRQLDVALAKAAQGEKLYADAVNELGLSVDELIALPLDQKLIAVNNALLANVRETERAAVAADLFGARNGAAIRQLQPEVIAQAAREVEVFGLNLSEVDAAKVELANDALSTISLAARGAGQQLTIALAPAIRAVGVLFFEAAEEAGGLNSEIEQTVDSTVRGFAFVIDAIDGVGRAFSLAANALIVNFSGAVLISRKSVEGLLAALDMIPGVDLTVPLENVRQAIEIEAGVIRAAIEESRLLLETPLAGNRLVDEYEAAKVAAEEAAAAAVSANAALTENATGDDVAGGKSKVVKLSNIQTIGRKREISPAIKAMIEAQKEYNALVLELRTDEERLNEQLRERLGIIQDVVGVQAEEREQARSRALAGAFGEAPGSDRLSAFVGGASSELDRLAEDQAKLDEWYQQNLDRLREYRDERLITEQEYNAQEQELKRQHEEVIGGIEKARYDATLVATEQLFGNLSGLTRQFAGEQSTAYKVLFAIEKGAAIARSIVAIQAALAQAAASGPFPTNLAAMASVASATAGLISTIASTSIQGQAHDGLMSVPKTGTYILEKGERVTTAETSAKLDRTLDSVQQGGGMGGKNIRIVNTFDSAQVVGDYMGSSDGEEVVMNIVRRNQQTIRSLTA